LRDLERITGAIAFISWLFWRQSVPLIFRGGGELYRLYRIVSAPAHNCADRGLVEKI
jgi:hypothetical protein